MKKLEPITVFVGAGVSLLLLVFVLFVSNLFSPKREEGFIESEAGEKPLSAVRKAGVEEQKALLRQHEESLLELISKEPETDYESPMDRYDQLTQMIEREKSRIARYQVFIEETAVTQDGAEADRLIEDLKEAHINIMKYQKEQRALAVKIKEINEGG